MTGTTGNETIPDTPASDLPTGSERLLLRVEGQVAKLTFNNPSKRNALSMDMALALPEMLQRLEQDPGVRVILVAGSGDRAFMSGADISEFGQLRDSAEQRAEFDRASVEMDGAWAALTKPVIAMIRGYCIGRGMLTALQAAIVSGAFAAIAAASACARAARSSGSVTSLTSPERRAASAVSRCPVNSSWAATAGPTTWLTARTPPSP